MARFIALTIVVAFGTVVGVAVSAAPAPQVSDREALDKYCVSCHNARLKTGGLSLDDMNPAAAGDNPQLWEKVVRKLRVGMMPPQGAPKPDEATRWALVGSLEAGLDRAAAAHPNPGHPSVHRLNRAEYAGAIRDLLALDVDAESLLPADNPTYGFDNIGEVLALSPALLERYASAAAQIATLAVGDAADVVPAAHVFRAPPDLSQDKHNDGLPLGTTGGFLVRTTLPLDGEYTIKANLFKTNLGLLRGLEFPRTLQFVVDGASVFSISIGGEAEFVDMLQNQTNYADALEAKLQARVALKAGPHDIGATFVPRADVANTRRLQAMTRTTSDTSETLLGPPHVMMLTVAGPFNPTGPGDTPSRRRIFACTPARAADEAPCARTIVSTLAHRAFRGTDTRADVEELMAFYRQGREGATFDAGIALALQRILTRPKFLFRVEREPAVAPGDGLPDQRPRAGVAPVVLSLEQHPRR